MVYVKGVTQLSNRRRRILEYTQAGLSPRQIADALQISTQRVYQQLAALRADGLLSKEGK